MAIVNDELVIDYIEKDSFEDDVHSKIIGALKTFADEYGYTVRASNVLANARNFWFRMGFVEEVSDFVYEGDL
ncbi:hypothetical protein KC845_01890 [Candidatus Kaiserbacteria bacterium]|nr:hypothetical protein [Candidatus Kaiserbacteria bacterium]